MQKIIYLLCLAILITPGLSFAESKKIVKWVDSNGVTHYGDKLPVQEAGRSNIEMSDRGLVIKRNIMLDKKIAQIDSEQQQQKLELARKDKILLASYTNVNEIDLALERNLQMGQAFIQSLTQQKLNVFNQITRINTSTQNFKANKKPVPPNLTNDLTLAQLESVKLDKLMAQRKTAMEATRKYYMQEKTRFIALKQPSTIDSLATATIAPSSAASSATASSTATEKSSAKIN